MVSEQGMVLSRRMWTIAEKRRIVEETLARGASVPEIARKYELNANLLFGWRRLYKQGLLESGQEPAAKLLPVAVSTPTVVATRSAIAAISKSRSRAARADPTVPSNHLEIAWPSGIRVRLHGAVDTGVLTTVLAAMAKNR